MTAHKRCPEVMLRRFYKIGVHFSEKFNFMRFFQNCSKIAYKCKSKELLLVSDLVHHAGHK